MTPRSEITYNLERSLGMEVGKRKHTKYTEAQKIYPVHSPFPNSSGRGSGLCTGIYPYIIRMII
jgi:hypothetical protein